MKKLLLILIVGMFLINFISALDFDNVKSYNSLTKTATITNAYGLGNKIADVTLKTPNVFYVIQGKDRKVAEFEVDLNSESYTDFISKIDLINNKNKKTITREITYKYKELYNVEVQDYKFECKDTEQKSINGTFIQSCNNVLTGSHTEQKERWLPLEKLDLTKGIITIGLFTDVYPEDNIEWIPTIAGVEISEWATWTSSLSVDLQAYYNFDDNSTNLKDDVKGKYNVTLKTTNWTTGILKNGYGLTAKDIGNTNLNLNANTTITVNFWIKKVGGVGAGAKEWITTKNAEADALNGDIMIYSNAGADVGIWWHIQDVASQRNSIGAQYVNSNWVMETLVINTTGAYQYVNGTLIGNMDLTNWLGNSNPISLFGLRNGLGNMTSIFIDEVGIWSRQLTPTEVSNLYNGGIGITYIDGGLLGNINVNLVSPADNLGTTETSINFSSNAAITNGNFTNATLYIWKPDTTLLTTNYTEITGSSNSTILSISEIPIANNYKWNVEYCGNNGSIDSSNCSYASLNRTLSISIISENSFGFSSSTRETQNEYFNFSLSTQGNYISSAYLIYNGTTYSNVQIINESLNNFTLVKSIDIPASIGNKSFYFNYILNDSSSIYASTTQYQYVNSTIFGLCNSSLTTPYLNITFKDESSLIYINASIPTSTFIYYLGSGTVNKTLNYINNSDNPSYALCSIPNDKTLKVDSYIQYKQGTTYPQRIYNPDLISYTNITTNQTLYLLSSINGIYTTFQVVNSADQLLSGVYVTAVRNIDGVNVIINSGTTGADGTITFWLNPDFAHDFNFSKSGYTTYSTNLIPTQSSYTITMSGGITTTTNDYTQGILYSIFPNTQELFNDTIYNFQFNVTSSSWELDSFGFNLRLKNGSSAGSSSSSTEGTPASRSYNVNNQSIIYMDYYWIIEGNITTGSTYWVISNTENTQWSIKNFFTDLTAYINSGMFGLDDFGRYLIIFIILFLSVGIMSYKYGLISPMAITTMTFGIIYFFDIVVGLIPTIRGVEHLLTYLAGLILIVIIFKEVMT